ncbi:MAG: septal ring lytic transglycosylase RlpA family lipoprotein [Thiothrix nivea]|nr:MAG: septal ring lytic transglycosylase RlpA family lipoprotein [Thiothrix nivea]
MPPVTMSTTKNMADVPDRCGNEPVYTLNGKTYQVLKSAAGYRAEGMASWYGAEFQGSKTAGCETFDMHGFTAAHRTLPLPSIVRVKNLQNGKSVIVRVNDRGPFENNGLIQLSFAAANTLGMTSGNRMAKVRVEALAGNRAGAAAVPRPQRVRPVKRPDPAQAAAIRQAKRGGKSFFVVVQNYQDQLEALEMFGRLTSVGLNKTELASAMSRGQKVHQVRIGPLYTQDQIDNVRDTLENNGLATFRVVEVDQ